MKHSPFENVSGRADDATRAGSPFHGSGRWWHVRSGLSATLLLVCALSATISVQSEVRAAVRATVLRPLAWGANILGDWTGWTPLGFATVGGTLAAAVLRRGTGRAISLPRSDRRPR